MRYGLLEVLFWCYLTFVSHAVEIYPPKSPPNELGITLDYSLAATWPKGTTSAAPRNFLWSSHLTFNGPVSQISVAQLWGLAFDAYNYIGDDLDQYGLNPDDEYPRALTVLAWGNEIILASGQKGENSFTYKQRPKTQVTLSLERCHATYLLHHPNTKAIGHRRKGKCGEQMAAHLYYRAPSTGETSLRDQNARIGTVVYGNDGIVRATPPCGRNNQASQATYNAMSRC